MSKSFPRRVTVVVPAYNEERTLPELVGRLFSIPDRQRYRFDLVIVDDGSHDDTSAVAKRLSARYPITLIRLARNFGKEAALLAGLDNATGDAVVIMDADLQHPVELIDKFLDQWEAGYDCVYARRTNREDEGILKRAFTKVFYRILNHNSEVQIVPDALDFRLLDRKVVDVLLTVRERVRFTKGLYAWVGYPSVGVPFVPDPRFEGTSRFTMGALVRLAWDGLTSFSDFPLRLSAIVGAIVACVSVAYALYITLRTLLLGVDVPGWATLTVATTFLSGLQMLFLGVIGEYIRNIYRETKHRPNYVIRELIAQVTATSGAGTTTDDRGRADSVAEQVPLRAVGHIAAV